MQSRIKIQQAFILKLVASRQRDNQTGYESYTWLHWTQEKKKKKQNKTKTEQKITPTVGTQWKLENCKLQTN